MEVQRHLRDRRADRRTAGRTKQRITSSPSALMVTWEPPAARSQRVPSGIPAPQTNPAAKSDIVVRALRLLPEEIAHRMSRSGLAGLGVIDVIAAPAVEELVPASHLVLPPDQICATFLKGPRQRDGG